MINLTNLPDSIRTPALAMQDLNNSPPEMTVPVLLSIMSYALQGRFNVDTRHFGSRPISLYALIVAESGALKSEIFKKLSKGIELHERDQRPVYEAEYAAYQAQKAVWDSDRKDADKEKDHDAKRNLIYNLELSQPTPPKLIGCVLESPTNGGMIDRLSRAHHSIMVMSAEAGSLFGGHALKSAEVKQQFTANLNKLWNAEKVERATTEVDQVITNRRMSMLLMTQMATVLEFVNDPLIDQMGLPARFLLSVVPSYQLPRWSLLDQTARQTEAKADAAFKGFARQVQAHLATGLTYDENDHLIVTDIAADNTAFAIYDDFQANEAALLRDQNDQPFFKKYVEHTLRLAAVMAAFDGETQITAFYMNAAIELMRYFAAQWLSLDTSANLMSKETSVIDGIVTAMKKAKKTSFTMADFKALRTWRGLSLDEKAKVITALDYDDRLEVTQEISGNGREVVRYDFAQK